MQWTASSPPVPRTAAPKILNAFPLHLNPHEAEGFVLLYRAANRRRRRLPSYTFRPVCRASRAVKPVATNAASELRRGHAPPPAGRNWRWTCDLLRDLTDDRAIHHKSRSLEGPT